MLPFVPSGLVANCQRSNKLLRLHLAGNLFKEAGCRVLIEVVKTHCSLQELDISNCHASSEQEADLKACIEASRSLHLSRRQSAALMPTPLCRAAAQHLWQSSLLWSQQGCLQRRLMRPH